MEPETVRGYHYLSGQVQANLTGTDPDAIVGRVAVEDFKARKPRKTYELDSMVLSLDKRGPVRMINIGSSILNLFAEGEFTLANCRWQWTCWLKNISPRTRLSRPS